MTPRSILVPVDFSPQAELALEYAIAMAHLFQARLILLHVIHTALFDGRPLENEAAMAAYVTRIKDDAQTAIASFAERLHDMGVDCGMVVTEGTPFETICEQADAHHADLIVMGSHGQTGLPSALIGSVAERVVRTAPCSVLVVKGAGTSPLPDESSG